MRRATISSSPLSKMDDGIGDIESAGNTAPSTLPPVPPPSPPHQQMDERVSKDANEPSWSQPLYEALRGRKWDAIKQILDNSPEAIKGPVGEDGDTPLTLAIRVRMETPAIQKLVDMMPPDALVICSGNGSSALHWAALSENLQVVKLLTTKNPALPNIRNRENALPVHIAFGTGKKEMSYYLYSVTSKDVECEECGANEYQKLIEIAIFHRMYDLALHLLQQNKNYASEGASLFSFMGQPDAFRSVTRLNMLQSIIYSCIHIKPTDLFENLERKTVVTPAIHSQVQSQRHSRVYQELQTVPWRVLQMLVGPIKNIRQLKLKHCQALKLVRILCEQFQYLAGEYLFQAIQCGIPEMVEEILNVFPAAINSMDQDGNQAFHLAAANRDEKMFLILYQRLEQLHKLKGNAQQTHVYGILHLVAKRPQRMQIDGGSRVVLQMQHELQWYKAMEKLEPPIQSLVGHIDGKTPLDVFDEDHQNMVKSEGEWIIGMANSCIVGGSLIATVVFAAAITVPGGNKDDGLPIFSKEIALKVFAFSDTFALVSSLTAVVIFLSIFTTRYSVNDFLYDLPNKLIIGLISLLLSVTFMMIAFSATVYLVFADDNEWLILPIAVLACIPVFFFAKLQLPWLLNMIRSTYGNNILKRVEDLKLIY